MPRRPDVPCAGCGKLLYGGGKGSLPPGERTCRECRRIRPKPKRTRPKLITTILCPICGTVFLKLGQKTCSHACSGRLRHGAESVSRKGRQCAICGAVFDASHANQRTCGRACGVKIKPPKPPRPPKQKPIRTCRGCLRDFTSDEPRSRWCSYRCRLDACGQQVKDLYGLAATVGAVGAQWRQLLVGYLRERDGGRCGICRRGIRFELPAGPRGDDRGPSIDHIIPRSTFADRHDADYLANLRLTHWGCNRRRRTGLPGESVQLALIG